VGEVTTSQTVTNIVTNTLRRSVYMHAANQRLSYISIITNYCSVIYESLYCPTATARSNNANNVRALHP